MLVAIGLGIWSALKDAPSYVVAFISLVSLAVILVSLRIIVWLWERRKTRLEPQVSSLGEVATTPHSQTVPSVQGSHLKPRENDEGSMSAMDRLRLAWLSQIAESDSYQLGQRVFVYPKEPVLHFWINKGYQEPRPYIEFVFGIVNASVFLVDVGKACTGHIKMDYTPLTDKLEVVPVQIMHGAQKDFMLKQYLSSQDINDLQTWNKSDTLPFLFNHLGVSLETKPPKDTGFESVKGNLSLSSSVHLRVLNLIW